MISSLGHPDGAATIAAAEGQVALAAGDTARAREKFSEAGTILERNVAQARKQSDKHFVRFLAASQYYKAGRYGKGLAICKKIQAKLLPPAVRPLFPAFSRDVRSRSRPGYEKRTRRELLNLWLTRQYSRLLEVLQEHPYVLPPGGLAFIGAVACEGLKGYRGAAVFYRDALKFGPRDLELIFSAAALPLTLPQEGRLDEAWEYARQQLEWIPHPVTYVSASLVCFHRASAAVGPEERRRLLQEQVHYFEETRRSFGGLPPDQQNHPQLRGYVALCYEAAAFGLLRLGDRRRAKEVCDDVIRFGPNSSGPWAVRGIVTYPGETAVADFEQAAHLKDETYYPYYYLAGDSLKRGDFSRALSWARAALERRPGPRIKSQLVGWTAICKDALGAGREEVEGLFRQALEIDPENEVARSNYQLFVASLPSRATPRKQGWQPGEVWPEEEQYLFARESGMTRAFDRTTPVRRELALEPAGS
jgi:tetratricopeptide (TPR) repeat protein